MTSQDKETHRKAAGDETTGDETITDVVAAGSVVGPAVVVETHGVAPNSEDGTVIQSTGPSPTTTTTTKTWKLW